MSGMTLAALLGINLWTMACFPHDKAQAVRGGPRVSEAGLLALAALGGTPGAFAARQLFRHKTRKQPFGLRLGLIAVVQLGAAIGFAVDIGPA